MPDSINKQSLVNLLIDSPLREPIKINLIDIVNNTSEPDLPKVFPTIVKELEIFQKATERRMKLAEETIAKLSGTAPSEPNTQPQLDSNSTTTPPLSTSPLDLPPLPSTPPQPDNNSTMTPSLSVPPLDLPPLPQMPSTPTEPQTVAETTPVQEMPPLAPLGGTPAVAPQGDEAALAEIQKELDSLKTTAADEVAQAAAPAPATPPAQV